MNDFIKLSSPATREFWKIPVLFEDESLLVLNKPDGVLTSPDRSNPGRPSLIKLLHEAIVEGKPWVRERGLDYLMNAHRLDCEVTGTLLLAKSKRILVTLVNAFGSEQPLQTFVALVKGSPPADTFKIETPTAQDMRFPGRMRVLPQKGKRTRTEFEVMERFRGFTLLRCVPLTQRRHQIRVHLRHAGYPICGDRCYGGRPLLLSGLKPDYRLKSHRTERPLTTSAALHAQALSWPHPVTGQLWNVEAPLPKELEVALKYLRQFAAASGPA